jgi:hypothetical protein
MRYALSKNIFMNGLQNCRSLGCPRFPVELGGFGKLHAPFLTERRTRGPVLGCVAGNPGSPGMTQGGGSRNNPTQAKRRLEWATHFLGGGELGHFDDKGEEASMAPSG